MPPRDTSETGAAERALERQLGVALYLAIAAAGPAALREVCRRAGLPQQERLTGPHAQLSLTHAGRIAVAAAVAPQDWARVAGIGVDYEPVARGVSAAAGRLYLGPGEQAVLAGCPADAAAEIRLRLWTVKEAAYKATPDNGGHTVAAYHVEHATARAGVVTCPRASLGLTYATVRLASGWLAVAVLPAEEIEEVRDGAL